MATGATTLTFLLLRTEIQLSFNWNSLSHSALKHSRLPQEHREPTAVRLFPMVRFKPVRTASAGQQSPVFPARVIPTPVSPCAPIPSLPSPPSFIASFFVG